jgi:hypothetical protein
MLATTMEDIAMDTHTRIHTKKHTPMMRDIITTTATIMNTSTITTVATNHPY